MYSLTLPDELLAEESRRFLLTWHRWRGAALLPGRADVALRDIRDLLPRIAILEIRSRENATFRLAGTQYRLELGFEPTGLNYVQLAPPAERQRRGELLYRQVRQPCAAVMLFRHRYASGHEVVFEIVSAPLRGALPDALGQVIALASKLERSRPDAVHVLHPQLNSGERLRHIDIGAGLPDRRPLAAAV
ncbi:MAG: PAS domain-containing protein [Alphaproteobacteria bacterium]|nr:PAS domain-containing protein [Alphaproteobacteria bacterium]